MWSSCGGCARTSLVVVVPDENTLFSNNAFHTHDLESFMLNAQRIEHCCIAHVPAVCWTSVFTELFSFALAMEFAWLKCNRNIGMSGRLRIFITQTKIITTKVGSKQHFQASFANECGRRCSDILTCSLLTILDSQSLRLWHHAQSNIY